MNCYKCKHPNLHGSNFCEKCGTDLKAPPPRVTPVHQYGGYHNPSASGYAAPPVRPGPAPRPSPAPRPRPAGGGYNPPPSQAPTPPPPSLPVTPPIANPAVPTAAPKRPNPVRRRNPIISTPPDNSSPAPAPAAKREPLPFGHLNSEKGLQFPLRYDVNLVGRASPGEGIVPQIDLTTLDVSGTVSRKHARIGKDDAAIFIEDLGSSNGTRHNGQTLREGMQTPLADGDQIVFGDLKFTFQMISPG